MRLSLCALLLSVLACGTLEISVDRTPTPDAVITGTVGALQAQNADLATKIAALNSTVSAVTNTPLPQPTNTTVSPTVAAVPAATRITLLNGATVGVVSAPIQAAHSQSYVLKALKAQPMFVFVASPHNDVTVSIKTQDGTNILGEAAHQNSWQGSLPQTGDYFLTIYGGASTENFSLTVTVPLRIVFAAGATSGTVNGTTAGGYGVSYALFAGKGQDMNVDIENHSDKASLSIYGFTDGQRFLRSDKGQTSFHFKLPSTQDYIIVVVPTADNEVSFTLTIKIQ
jgi:hypothetical protein